MKVAWEKMSDRLRMRTAFLAIAAEARSRDKQDSFLAVRVAPRNFFFERSFAFFTKWLKACGVAGRNVGVRAAGQRGSGLAEKIASLGVR